MNRVARKKGGEVFRPGRFISALGLSFLLVFGQTAPLLGNPTGGAVVAGSATIGSAGSTLTINQSTASAIINWQQFSIAGGELTKFLVPNSAAATLNRVVGGNPSQIYGTLQSNGLLYLVNPNGIVVGPGGVINTAGFMASTYDISNEQFLAGGNLSLGGASSAAINNEGKISASNGDVYLIADQVNNGGTITAPQGTVGLAAGSNVLYQQAGSQHLLISATPAGTTRATGVTNAGTISAAAAELKAAGGNAYALAINNTGVIAATGYKKINGQVYLTSDGGSITNGGRISAQNSDGSGGTIVVDGTATSSLTSGVVTNSGVLDASAMVADLRGGAVTLRDMGGTTIHSGKILAKGGKGGAGGNAEVSGKVVQFTGTVDLTAPGGTTGNLLLDPSTLDVITGGTGTVASEENDSTSTEIDPLTVENALGTANLTLNANTNITVTNGITWTSSNTLTLSTNTAGSTINLNAPISGVNGGLTIDTAAATDYILPQSSIDVANFILQSGSWQQAGGATLPAFTASNDFEVNGSSLFIRSIGSGTGIPGAPYQIADIYGLQGMDANNELPGVNAVLVNDINASGTATWNGGAGFVPIGSSTDSYTGTFNGQGFTINDLHINNTTSTNGVGLFGYTGSGAVIENVGVTNANIGGYEVGALVGSNGGMVESSYATGMITGSSDAENVGGLVGENSGTVELSYATATVSGNQYVGGLAGYNVGTVETSYATGGVTGLSEVGGLVGVNYNTVETSNATGAVNGTYYVGGLVGQNSNMVESSYASGAVTGAGSAEEVGGLAGVNDGTVQTSYATGAVLAGSGSEDVGGLLGSNNVGETVETSYATGSVTGGSNSQYVGGLVGQSVDGTVQTSFATGDVVGGTGTTYVGGLVGYSRDNNIVELCYATGSVSGYQYVGGLVGANAATVETSFATGAVTDNVSNAYYIGGLVGDNQGILETSYATGAVASSSGSSVGGLAGSNEGTVKNSYATGAVTGGAGSLNVGGLVGQNSSIVETSYATGAVSGNEDVGGLVGSNDSTVTASYWAQDSGLNVGLYGNGYDVSSNVADNTGATPETLANLKLQSTFAPAGTGAGDWDFTTPVWTTNGNTTAPLLTALSVTISGTTPGGSDVIDLISNGVVLYTGTASGNNYSLTVPDDVLANGALLTDLTGSPSANTYYQLGVIPTSSITLVDLSTSALVVEGTGPSTNTQLGNALGSLNATTYGLIYTVDGSHNLTANSGVNIYLNSPYVLDGNITTSGTGGLITSAPLTASASSVILTANGVNLGSSLTSTGTVKFNVTGSIADTGAVQVGSFILQSGYWQQTTTSLPAFSVSNDFELQGSSTFLRAGDGAAPYTITDIYGLQGLGSPSGNLLGVTAMLVNNINASGTSSWNSGAGFVPIGNNSSAYTGTFNGQGYTINGLTINTPGNNFIGLFGETDSGATIENVGVTNVNVSGSNDVGGLVGYNSGIVEMSYATGTVTGGSGSDAVGGLVGYNNSGGTVETSYATGTVSGTYNVGGLLGANSGTEETSYATGTTSGSQNVGGLVGFNYDGSVETSYATGPVSGSTEVGGLVGQNNGSVETSYWAQDAGLNVGLSGIGYDDNNSGVSDNIGATPETLAAMEQQSTFTPTGASPTDWDFTTPVWTTYGNSNTPQLVGLPETAAPTLPVDTLSGTAFTDSGVTFSPDITIDLVSGGSLLFSTTTSGTGTFTFDVNSSLLTSGVLLVDPSANGGNTYYQANSPSNTITGVDIWGSTIRVQANTASNAALATAAGSLTAGIDYGVSNGGIFSQDNGFMTLSNYTLDGNITAKNITINGVMTSSSATAQKLSAAGNITIGANVINTAGGGLTLQSDYAGTGVGTVAFNNGAQISTTGAVTIFYNPSVNPAGSAVNTTSYVNPTENYSADVTGGATLTAYMLVNTLNDLQNVQNNPAGNYALSHDIDATATSGWNSGAGFIPIGNSTTNFTGIFNGSGYIISGLTENTPGANYAGLFGYCGTGATIENVGLTNIEISGYGATGALVGNNNGTIEMCYDTGAITGGAGGNIGGLAGFNGGTISNSYSTADVVVGSGSTAVGGLVGGNLYGTISNSFSAGAVSTGSGSIYVGGLVGNNGGGTLSNTYSTASVTSPSGTGVGGLAGRDYGGVISNSYSTGLVSSSGGTNVGGFVGFDLAGATFNNNFWDTTTAGSGVVSGVGSDSTPNTTSGVTGDVTSALLSESTYSGAGWNIGTSLGDTWVIFNGQTRPMLAMEYSTTITNAHQLQLIGLNSTTQAANYTVANNIDLTGTTNASDVWGTSTTNGGVGFYPIGAIAGNPFSGTFNGQFYAINGLYIKEPGTNTAGASYLGLFGEVNPGAIVENVGLTNVNVAGYADVGGLAGENDGTISNAYVTGAVQGAQNGVGGLVGVNSGTLTTSYSTVDTVGSAYVGSLAGVNAGLINNAYSTGAVSGGTAVGGLVGYNNGGTIGYTYSTGMVGVSSDSGGLVGANGSGSISNSFWDTASSGQTVGVGSGTATGVTGATTSQLTSQTFITANAPGWNFASVWNTLGGTLTPQLVGLPETALPTLPGDTLSGTAYTNSGVTATASGTTIDLVFDGSLLGSTTTNGSGAFTFNVSATDLTGGILLTDATDNGNTYYQANSPASTISGIDIWGSTLRVMADTASNTALGTAAGTLSGAGINYSVNAAALATNSGVNMNILSHYALDGNVTTTEFTTAPASVVTGSSNVTINAGPVELSGSLTTTGSLSITTSNGTVDFASETLSAGSLNVNADESVTVTNSSVTTTNGDLTLSGTGLEGTSGPLTSLNNGVDVSDSTLEPQGGNLSLTGMGGYTLNGNYYAGEGISISGTSVLKTTGSDTISLTGSAQTGVGAINTLVGVDVETTGTPIQAGGALSVTASSGSTIVDAALTAASATINSTGDITLDGGIATSGTQSIGSSSGAVSLDGETLTGSSIGVSATNDAQVTSSSLTTTGGDLTLSGNGLTSTSGPLTSLNNGVDVTGSTLEAQGGNLSLTGIGGYTLNGNYYAGEGVLISGTSLLETTGSHTITLTGSAQTGIGAVNTLVGVDVEASGTPIQAGGALSLSAPSGGDIDANANMTAGGALTMNSTDGGATANGVISAASATLTTAGAITLEGSLTTTGAVSATTTQNNGSIILNSETLSGTGINLSAEGSMAVTSSSVTTTNGDLTLSGTGLEGTSGALTSLNNGVDVTGSTLEPQGGNLSLTGIGGYTLNGNYYAGEGVLISGTSLLETTGSHTITLTGSAQTGVGAVNALVGVDVEASGTPIQAGGALSLSAPSGGDIDANANMTAGGALTMNSTDGGATANGVISASSATLTTAGAITLEGSLTTTGAVSATTTQNNGSIILNSETLSGPSVSLSAAGSMAVTNSSVTTTAGDLMLSGTGLEGSSGALTNLNNGVDVSDSTLEPQGGNLSLMGIGGYTLNGNYYAGDGISISGTSVLKTTGSHTITLTGSAQTGIGAVNALVGVDVEASGTPIQAGGALSITASTGGMILSGGTLTAASATINSAADLTLADDVSFPGNLTISAATQIEAAGSVGAGSFILQNGTWQQIVGQNGLVSLPTFTDSGDFEMQGSSTFERFAGGDGSLATPYQIADVYGLQGLASPSGSLLSADAELVNNIDATGTANWNSGAGFIPIGNYTTSYTGTFNGQSNTINALFINTPSANGIGLFGKIGTGALVENVGVTNVQVSGDYDTGGLVGFNFAGTVEASYATGTVSGYEDVGVLVGLNNNMVETSYATGAVSGTFDVGGLTGWNEDVVQSSHANVVATGVATASTQDIGGLVGLNSGTVETSYALGAVNGYTGAGGLVGLNNGGTVETSYATGAVTGYSGANYIGGLVGWNEAVVETSYATGEVTGAAGSIDIGGLVGLNDGTVQTSFASGEVNGYEFVGGLVGYNDNESVETSYSIGAVNGTLYVGGLVGFNQGTVETGYSTGAITGSSNVGGLVGYSSGTVDTSYWATDAGGQNASLSTIGDNAGTIDAYTSGETLANMELQSTFTPAGAGVPNWDFTNTWTTNGNTVTPELIGVTPGAVAPGLDTLSGTAFTDNGVTETASGTTIDLIFDGSLLGSTTTSGSGGFSFNVSATDLTGGILLTDPTDKGNTYYQANSPASITSGIDLWGSTLRVLADAAGNTALGTAAGSLSGAGINYTVNAAALATNTGVNMSILDNFAQDAIVSQYTLDGNITASGSLGTSASSKLIGSASVTLTGSSVAMAGTFNRTGSLAVTSTSGAIVLNGVGTSVNPAMAAGITLTSASYLKIEDSYLKLSSGNFTASGTGYVSSVDANGDPTGVHIYNSTINAQGGNISLTGDAGYDNPGGGLGGGFGVHLDGNAILETTGSGNITIMGTSAQNITTTVAQGSGSTTGFAGVEIDGTGNSIQAASGAISITGIVSAGTAGNSTIAGFATGLFIDDGTDIAATGNGGSISLTGNATGATGLDFSNNGGSANGIDLDGNNIASNLISVATNGSITMNGTGGVSDSSADTNTSFSGAYSNGVTINGGDQITAGNGSTISITGHGGSATTTGQVAGGAGGVRIGADADNTAAVGISVGTTAAATGSISIIGTGGTSNTVTVPATSSSVVPSVEGVQVISNTSITADGAATISLHGTGGTITSGANQVGDSIGVIVDSLETTNPTSISSSTGNITVTGIAGTSPNLDVGVDIFGTNDEPVTLATTSGTLSVTGTGGSASTGSNTVVGFKVPSFGVGVADDTTLQTTTGTIDLVGYDAAGVAGVSIEELPAGSFDPTPTLPTIMASAGAFTANALSGTGINLGADITATTATFISAAGGNVTVNKPSNYSGSQLLIEAPLITLNAAITAASGNIVLDDSSQFVNNAGASVLSVANGYDWQVWSVNPAGSGQGTVDTDDGLTPNFIQYGATYGVTTPAASGDGLLYSYAPAALAVTLNGTFTKTYDSTLNLPIAANSYTYSTTGLVTGDTIGVGTGAALTGTLNSKDVPTANSFTVTPAQITYDVTQGGIPVYGYTVGSASGSATVTAATATASLIGTVSKVYDATTTATLTSANYNLAGVYGGDTVNLNDPTTGSYDTANVGTGKTVTVSGLAISGAQSADYNLASSSISAAIGVITAAPLNPLLGLLTGTVSKVYDGTLTVSNLTSANYALSGVMNGDTVILTGPTTGTYASPNVGTGILVTSSTGLVLSGAQAGNYYLTNTQASGNIGIITPAALTIGTSNVTKTYNGSDSALGTAIVTSGTLYTNVGTGVQDSLSGGTFAFTDPNAGIGDKTVTVGGVTVSDGNGGNNYTVTYANNTASTINPASLTVSTSNVTKTYDGSDTALGTAIVTAGMLYTNVGTGVPDSVSGGTFAFTNPNVGIGNKTVTVSGVTITDANDYTVTYAPNTTSTINQASLTLTVNPVTKTYDGTDLAPGATFMLTSGTLYTNVGTGVQDSVSGGTFAFTNPNAGIGNKTVTVSGVAIADGNGGNNYTVTYVPSTISTINPASLTVTANDDTVTYSGNAYSGGNGVTYSGFQGTDNAASLPGTLTYSGNSQGAINAGGYVITPGGYTPGNYTYVYNSGALTINPAPLTYNATPVTITDSSQLPMTFTGTITGFLNSDTLTTVTTGTPLFYTTATASSPYGSYAIDGSGLTTTTNNYVLVQAAGNATALTIQGAPPPPATIAPVLPVITPQPQPVVVPTTGGITDSVPPPPPPVTIAPPATTSAETTVPATSLASSDSNTGQVSTGDAAQLSNGQLNNVANPHASGTLNEALGPVVFQTLSDALQSAADWTDADIDAASTDDTASTTGNGSGDTTTGHGHDDVTGTPDLGPETILSGGDVAEVAGNGTQKIPLSKAPPQLQKALASDVLAGMPASH